MSVMAILQQPPSQSLAKSMALNKLSLERRGTKTAPSKKENLASNPHICRRHANHNLLTSLSVKIHSRIISHALRFLSFERRVETYKFTEHRSRRYLMKSSKLMIAIAFAVFALLNSAFAQTGAIRATIPFDFTVGKQTMAAGDYTVKMNGTVLNLTRMDGQGFAFAPTYGYGYNKDASPRLVFHRYGKRAFLSQAWIANSGRELFASPMELEYARTTKQEETTVLASLWPN
jgi:hypothetical protein